MIICFLEGLEGVSNGLSKYVGTSMRWFNFPASVVPDRHKQGSEGLEVNKLFSAALQLSICSKLMEQQYSQVGGMHQIEATMFSWQL